MESSHPRAGRKSRKLGSRRRHQMKEVADEDGPPVLDSEQWPSQATEELQDFFRECGAEHKGFITREDLRKAKFSFLGNPEELELIFEWLDPERKGSLTIKEFTSGLKNVFSSQTRIPGSRKRKPRTWVFSKEEPTSFQPLEEVDPEERRWFLSFMEQLGTDHLLLDQAEIWQLWKKLRQEEPHLVGNLEGFLAKVTSRLQETQAEKETLQMTLKKYDDDHYREVRQLYEEMEHQIHSEKQRLQAASDTQGLAYSSMMHQALEAKEQEMQHLAEGQRKLEAQIDLLKSKRHEVSIENQRLQETQRDLTGQLEQVQGQLQVTRGHLNLARGQVAWQVEEETSLSSDPPVDPKNTSDSQHFTSLPEEDPLPSLFEEGDWSQLLSNFTSPLPGNTTQISWSPPPTPTSLKGYHTPRIVRQISITKRNSWQLNQESPSDPEVLPRSPLGSSEAPAVVPELNVAGELEPGKTFQWDFQRVSSGEPATTTWGQAVPELGDFLASSDSLPSQDLAGSGKGFGETDGDEVGQGDGPISDLLSKGPRSEVSLQTLGPSTDIQTDTWKVGAKEILHPGLPPAVSEQEVGSWGKEVFTLGPDVLVESPELMLIKESIPMREKGREKMNTEGWEIETNQQYDACGQEAELRESAGSVVSEVPGEESKSTESPGPDVGEVPSEESRSAELPGPDGDETLGEGYRITELPRPDVDEVPGEDSRSAESPGPDEGEVPGEDSRFTKSPGPDVENALSQKAGLTDSPGPEIGNPDAQETSHVESPRTIVNSVLSQEGQILRSLESDVEKVPGQKSQLIHLVRVTELPGTVIGNATEKKFELIMSPTEDKDNAFGQKAEVLELARGDVGNALCEEAGTLESAELQRDNHPGQQIGLLSSPSPDVDVYPSYEARPSNYPGVGDTTELHRLTIKNASDHDARFRISLEIDSSSQEAELTGLPGPDEDDVSGHGTRFMESWKIDIKDASGKEAQVLYSPEPKVGETFRQENVFMSSLGPDRTDVTGTDLGDAAIQNARITELYKDDVRHASSDQGTGLMELHVDDTVGQENGFIQSDKTDMENISGQEVEILCSPGLDSSDVPGQGADYIESPGSVVIDVAVQEAGLMNSSVTGSADFPSQEDKLILPEKDISLSATQESDVESGLDVGNSLSQEARHDIGGNFLYSSGPDIGDAFSQETRLTELTRRDVDDAIVPRPGVIELFKVDVGNVSDQENRLIKSSRIDAPIGKTELVELSGPEMGDNPGQEVKFGGLCKMDVGDVEMAEIMYSPVPDMHDLPGQKSGVVELHGLCVSESPIQARVLESDVRDGPGQEVMTRESHEADVGNASPQDTEIMHSPRSDVRDSADPKAETVQSSGPYVRDSIGQEAGVTELVRPDVGNAPDQEARFMPSSETHVSDACEEEAEILHSPDPDEEDSPGQEGEPKESSMLDLEGAPGQEGSFLELSEAGVDIGSSQQTRETGSPGPNVNEAPGQEAGIRESYETDLRDALGNEVEFGPDEGDAATNEGILILETQQSNVSDVFNSGRVVELIESCGPEVGDISHQEAEIMNSPGSINQFHQETIFMELGETDVGDAEVTYSPVPDMSESLGQEVMTRESHETDVGNASAQDTEIMHSPRPGVRDSSGPKAETVQSPGPYMGDSIGHEAGVPELDVGNAPDQEARFMSSSETHVSDACEEAEILHSPGPDEEDSPGQEGEPKESSMPDLEGAPGQEAGIRESYETDLRDASGNEVEFGPDVGDAATNEGILILETQQSNVSDVFNSGRVVELIESCGPEGGDISHQEAEIMNSPGSIRRDAFHQETMVMELGETDVGNAAEITYSLVLDMSESLGQEIMTRESHEADVGNASEIMHSSRPGVRDSSGPKAETVQSPGPYVGDSIGHEAGVPELDVGNAPDQEAIFMSSSETHVNDTCEEAEILHSPGPGEEDSPGQEGEPKESLMLDLEGAPGQEGSFLALSEAGVDIGSSQQTRETGLPGPNVNEAPGQEAGIRESYETDLRDASGNEVVFGPDRDDAATNEGILILETQQSNVNDVFNSGQVVELIESYAQEVGDISHQEAEIMNSPGSDRRDAFHQETMFMELGETDVGNAEITYSLVPDMTEFLGQEVMTRESHEADVGNASAQDTEIMHSPRPDVRDSSGPKAETVQSPGPYVGDSIGQEAGVPELDVGNAPDQEARFMPSSETHVNDACEEAEILHSAGPDEEDSPGQEGEPKESSMLGLEGTPGQEGSFLELSEAGMEDVFNHQVEQTESLGSDVRDILGQEAEFKKSCERDEEDTLGLIQPTVLEETTSQEGNFLESPEEGVENGSKQQTGQVGSPEADVEDAPDQEAGIRESYETDLRDASGNEVEFGPHGGNAATNEGILILETQQSNVSDAFSDAFNSGQVVELIESCRPEVGDISHQEAEIMNSPGSDRHDAFHQETMFMKLGETDVGDAAEVTYSLVLDMSESLGQEIMTRESHEADVGNVSPQDNEIMHSPRPDVRDSAGPKAETVQSPGPYVGDSIGHEAGVPELDVGNAPDQETRFMPSSETRVNDACEEAGILHSPGPDEEDSPGQEGEPKESSMLGLEGAPGQEAGIRESYKIDLRDALGNEVEFGPDVGDTATNEGILILETQQSNVSDVFNSGQVVELIESCGPEVGDISHQEAEIMNSPGSIRRDAFHQETMFMELGETDVGDAEVTYSPVPDMSESLGQEVMTRESHEADVGNASAQDTEIMHSPRPDVRDSSGPKAETVQSPGPYVGDSIGHEAGVPELDVGNAPDQEARFMPSSETHVSDACEEAEILHSPGPGEEDSPGQEGEPKESSMLDLEGAPGQEGSFLELSEAGVDIGSSQQTRETGSPGPNVNEAPGQEAGIRESYETDLRDALGNEVEFGPDVGDTAANEGILILETQQSNVSDVFNSGWVVELIESCGPEVGDISHQEAEIMNSPGSIRRDAFHQETMFMELGETDVGNAAEITYSLVPDMSESLGQEVMTRESHEADVGNASAQDTEIMHSPRPDVRDSSGPKAETVQSPGPYVGDSIGQEAGVPELDVGNAPDPEARFMSSSETHVSDACEEAEILRSAGPDAKDSPGQEGEPKESSMTDLGGAPGQEGSFLALSEAGMEDVFNHQVEQTESLGSDVRDILGQEAEFKKSCERDEEDTLGLIQPTVLEETTSQEGNFLESPEEGVENRSRQQTGQVESPEADVEDAPDQEAGIRESYETDLRDALGNEVEFGPDEGDAATNEGILILETQQSNVNDAFNSGQVVELIESCGPEVGDISHQEAEIMNSPGSDRHDAFHQETMFMELGETDVGDTEITYSLVLDMSESLGQEIMTRESHEADVENVSPQDTEIMHSPRPDVRDSAGPKAETVQSPGPYVGDSIGHEAGVPELDVGNAPDQEARFMPLSETHVSDPCEEAEILRSPGPDEEDSPGQEGEPKESSMLGLEGAPGQEAGIRESYETDLRDALGNEVEFGPDVGDTATNEGILMVKTQRSNMSNAFNSGQVVELVESCRPEIGDISHQEAEIMNSPGSDRCDAFHQETMFMELCETDVGNAEIIYSLVPNMSESLGQEIRVLASPETDVRDGPGQEVMTRESHEADVGNTSAQATEIRRSPRPGVRDSAALYSEVVHSPGPNVGDSIGQEAGVPELDVGNAPDQEARFMPLSETHVSGVASQGAGNRELCVLLGEDIPDQEAEILHLPGPDGEDSPGQEAVLSALPVQILEGAPIQESRFLELSEAGVHEQSYKQAGYPGSPAPGVRDTPVKETEILHSPKQVVSDYPHQGIDSLTDSFRPVIDILSDEEVQLPESAGPRVGDAPEEKPGNVESPRPDVLPVVPEHGGLQDQNSEAVWRAEDGVLQRQAQEGFLLPKDSSGDALGPQDSGQALSIPVEAEAQPECRVPGGQITPFPEPREENSSEVMKKANLKSQVQATGVSPGGEAPEPDYLFHVLFLGDSNVGKTSFLHLLHHDSFATGLTATVGMDYRIKNLMVDNRRFALQLWDTAGQERYHSITKQFLRKADGIVLMYDVTCPGSFTHVRYWLDCIQEHGFDKRGDGYLCPPNKYGGESGPDDVVILLLGNKIDCVKERLVSTEVGQLLAKEIGVIFGECSAVLGHNILEPIVTLARAMQEQDTKLKHSVVKLEKKEAKKAGCCS